jgi:hypothetical protein
VKVGSAVAALPSPCGSTVTAINAAHGAGAAFDTGWRERLEASAADTGCSRAFSHGLQVGCVANVHVPDLVPDERLGAGEVSAGDRLSDASASRGGVPPA